LVRVVTGESREPGALAQALAAAGLAYTEPTRARRDAESALAAAPGDAEVASAAQRALGMAASASGDYADATARLHEAAEIADTAGLPLRAGQARGSLAYVLLLTTGASEALRELDRADATLSEGSAAARLQMQRGLILSEIRRFDEAAASLDQALATLAHAGGDDLLEADIRNNRAIVHLGVRQWAGAHEELNRAEALYEYGGHLGRTAMVFHNRGVVDALRGDLPAALTAFDEAAERYRAAGLYPGLLSVDRAESLLSVRLVAEARAAAERAVEEFSRQRNAVDLVQARVLLAEAALLDGDYATAFAEADRARRSAVKQGRSRWAALAAYLRLQARWRIGAVPPSALKTGTRVAAELADAEWEVQSLDARLMVAQAALRLGRTDLARTHLDLSRSAKHTGPAELRVRAWHAEAILRRADGDRAGAARAVRSGLAVLEQFQASLGATELRADAFAHAEDLARLGVRLAMESGRVGAVFTAAERGRAGALRFRAARPPRDDALVADLAELRQVVTLLRSDDVTERDALIARQETLEAAVQDRARHAAGSTGHAQQVPGTATLRAELGAAVLVEYVELDDVLHAVVFRDGRFTLSRAGSVQAVNEGIDTLRTGLAWLAHGAGSARSMTAVSAMVDDAAARLDGLLLGPVRGDSPLVIVPTGNLHALPWSALPGCAARAVSVVPSAALWHRARAQAARAGHIVLAYGPDLPHARAEVTALAGMYADARVFTEARVADVLASLEGADVAHLAAHGQFRTDNPMFSALRLADGPLTVYDLERLAAPPRRVVLAACDSGLASVRSGDGLIGLAAALLALGSVSLIAAVLPVPDDASRELMVRFHDQLRAGRAAADALRRARAEIADSGIRAANVAAAGFVCFGV
jgi:tetratricopeptide (TPR) repeat protein